MVSLSFSLTASQAKTLDRFICPSYTSKPPPRTLPDFPLHMSHTLCGASWTDPRHVKGSLIATKKLCIGGGIYSTYRLITVVELLHQN